MDEEQDYEEDEEEVLDKGKNIYILSFFKFRV